MTAASTAGVCQHCRLAGERGSDDKAAAAIACRSQRSVSGESPWLCRWHWCDLTHGSHQLLCLIRSAFRQTLCRLVSHPQLQVPATVADLFGQA
jgi:hypothetical protein